MERAGKIAQREDGSETESLSEAPIAWRGKSPSPIMPHSNPAFQNVFQPVELPNSIKSAQRRSPVWPLSQVEICSLFASSSSFPATGVTSPMRFLLDPLEGRIDSLSPIRHRISPTSPLRQLSPLRTRQDSGKDDQDAGTTRLSPIRILLGNDLGKSNGFASRKQKLSSHVYYDDQLDEISSTDHKKDMYSTTDSMPDSTTGNDFWNDFWPALNGQLITSQEGSGSRVVSSKGGAESLARKGGAEIWNPGAQFSAGSWTEMGYPRGLGSSQSQSYGGFWSDRSASVEQQQDGTTQPKQQEAIRQSEQFSALQQHVLLCHQQSTAQHHQQPGDWSTQRHESAQQQQQQLSTSSNNPVSSQNLDVNDNQLQQLHQLHQLHHLQQLRALQQIQQQQQQQHQQRYQQQHQQQHQQQQQSDFYQTWNPSSQAMDVNAASAISFLNRDFQSNAFPKLGSLLQRPDASSQDAITQMRPEFEAHKAAIKEAKSGDVDERHPQYQAQSQKNATVPQSANAASVGLGSKSTCFTKPAPRTNRVVRPVGDPKPPMVDMMTCCVQLTSPCGKLSEIFLELKKSSPNPFSKSLLAKRKKADGDNDGDIDDQGHVVETGQSPIERHRLLAWRPQCNPYINMDIFKSRNGMCHSVNIKGAKSWKDFEDATNELCAKVRQISPGIIVEQKQARVALTKSSFHLGFAIDWTKLKVPTDFAEIYKRKKKSENSRKEQKTTKSNGGLVLKLRNWDAKVMLHSNGRGDMWWSTHDISKMTDAYDALRKALFDSDQSRQSS